MHGFLISILHVKFSHYATLVFKCTRHGEKTLKKKSTKDLHIINSWISDFSHNIVCHDFKVFC